MSWLARSLVNSLVAEDDQGHGDRGAFTSGASTSGSVRRSDRADELEADSDPPILGHRLVPRSSANDLVRSRICRRIGEAADVKEPAGIRSDFAEIWGWWWCWGVDSEAGSRECRTMRRLEGSHLLSEEVTEEVMVFAGNMTSHPETWHDFPLFNEFEDTNDFEMSDAQQEHAMAVVSLEPRLAALRIELCPTHMSEGCFWKIYFILLHSRLNKHDTELLSTPQV